MSRTIDEDLEQLERDIRQLKIEYEQYFGGGKARPPAEVEWRIDNLIKRYSDRGAAMNYTQRFRYGGLTQMYTKYREMFRKRLKQKEEGTVVRHFGAAAREIEKQRAKQRPPAAPEPVPVAQHPPPFAVSWAESGVDRKKVEKLFEAFREAKSKVGDESGLLTFDAFANFVRQKTEELRKQKDTAEVEYIVTIDGKQARLKARVKS